MENHYIEKIVHRILSGKQYLYYNDVRYELRNPSIDLKLRADAVYDKVYSDNLYSDFLLESSRKNYLILNNIISTNHYDIIDSNKKGLNKAKIKVYKEFIDDKKTKKNKLSVRQIEKNIDQLYADIHSIDFLILEHYANTHKNEFLIRNTLYLDNKLVFGDDDIEYSFFNDIMQAISLNMLNMSDYKEVARSDYWRSYYTNNKNHLFNVPSIEYSEEQRAILNISVMYDRIYEHPECPTDKIIADDDALDGWMLDQQEKIKQEKNTRGVNNTIGQKAANSDQVFIPASSKESAKEIYALNSEQTMNDLRKRQEQLEKEGSIDFAELEDVKRDLKNKLRYINYKRT